MKRSSLLVLILLHVVAAHGATAPRLALPSQQADGRTPTRRRSYVPRRPTSSTRKAAPARILPSIPPTTEIR
jgi:hypothetical protein